MAHHEIIVERETSAEKLHQSGDESGALSAENGSSVDK
jgi:hypothetical protein